MADLSGLEGIPSDIQQAIVRHHLAIFDLAEAVTASETHQAVRSARDARFALGAAIRAHLRPALPAAQTITLAAPRFANTYCSQCGAGFGPGNAGFSSCSDHARLRATPAVEEVLRAAAPSELLELQLPADDTDGSAS